MGQKVHPHGLRVGVIKNWDSRWFADKKNFADSLVEDDKLRKFLKKKLFAAAIDKIEIEKKANKVVIFLHTAKPGVIIGRGGTEIDNIKAEVSKMINKEVHINIVEVKNPDLSAQLVAENIAAQLVRRISYRKAMKQAMGRTMKSGAKGIKTNCSGRLGGAEIARSEHYHEGTIPLQTLRADIDYGFAEADTTYGKIGVKVWIYKGEILTESKRRPQAKEEASAKAAEANIAVAGSPTARANAEAKAKAAEKIEALKAVGKDEAPKKAVPKTPKTPAEKGGEE